MIAVLDSEIPWEKDFANGILRVNWLRRGSLFDFESVEIVRATDHDVERFCIQVRNEEDIYRRGRYRNMACGGCKE
ncbi:MAG: hypothetical protein RMK18_11645 [Armatimonadota bacterium]|nr:hypothetical protein [Armatimonadota bacterium]MDW8026499.1 hypothetical protein [Armatimonadota bacterium]